MHEFHRGVPAILRNHAGMRRATLHLDEDIAATLAPDRDRIWRITRLHVEFNVVLLRQGLDQLSGARGAELFAVIEQQGDGGVVLEAEVMQYLQRRDGVDDARLFITNPGTVGAVSLD